MLHSAASAMVERLLFLPRLLRVPFLLAAGPLQALYRPPPRADSPVSVPTDHTSADVDERGKHVPVHVFGVPEGLGGPDLSTSFRLPHRAVTGLRAADLGAGVQIK